MLRAQPFERSIGAHSVCDAGEWPLLHAACAPAASSSPRARLAHLALVSEARASLRQHAGQRGAPSSREETARPRRPRPRPHCTPQRRPDSVPRHVAPHLAQPRFPSRTLSLRVPLRSTQPDDAPARPGCGDIRGRERRHVAQPGARNDESQPFLAGSLSQSWRSGRDSNQQQASSRKQLRGTQYAPGTAGKSSSERSGSERSQ